MKNVYRMDIEYETAERRNTHGENVTVYKLLVTEEMVSVVAADFYASEEINKDIFICDNCANMFVRGIFIADGTINDPESGYHLEFAVSDPEKRDKLREYLAEQGIIAKSTVRRNVGSLYINGSETILDLLTYIGAAKFTLDIINHKIKKSIVNNENRRRNCDMANLYKLTDAAAQVIKAIKQMVSDGKIDGLDEQLRETALLRVKYPELSMKDLADIHEPPISKSGLYHRLEKIMRYYNDRYSDRS